MAHIQQLSPHVADMIAAGEVVERPASVVKELMENAIDAGATALVVEIQRGGMASIRVTDNGCGIPQDEIATAFLRHATSKLREAGDLAAIGTLGFRGEALAAISAVSRVDIFSRRQGAASGASLSLEAGTPGQVEEVGCPEGTTIVVKELFFNTPARLKFMKTDTAESSAVASVVQQTALSHPGIAVRYIRDGKEELHTPGDGKLLSAIYAAKGRDFAHSLVEVEGSGENGITVRGFVTKPLEGRGSRSMQTFFCRGRLIKSPLLTAALEEAYANRQMKGRFPGCVLHVDLPPAEVDVNVHPAKTVVKFAHERAVFSAVHHIVADTLDQLGRPAAPAPAPTLKAAPRQDFYQTMDAKTFRETLAQEAQKPAPRPMPTSEFGRPAALRDVASPKTTLFQSTKPQAAPGPRPDPRRPDPGPILPLRDASPVEKPKETPAFAEKPPIEEPPVSKVSTISPELVEKPAPIEEEPPQIPAVQASLDLPEQTSMEPEAPEAPWRFVGEILRTYIVAEDGDNVWLIDKHAAHERINFDRLKANTEPIMGQQLLSPQLVELPQEQYAALLDNLPLLEEFGFEAEDFGSGALMVRTVPADIDESLIRETLEMLADKLLTAGAADPASARDAMLHTMACKAAIKGGWVSDPLELQALIGKVQSGQVQFCPHGRPVKVKLTRYELEKMFKRA